MDYETDSVCQKTKSGRKHFIPGKVELQHKVTRRSYLCLNKVQRCKSWTNNKCKEWLALNPIINSSDIQFIRVEEQVFKNITKNFNEETEKQSEF